MSNLKISFCLAEVTAAGKTFYLVSLSAVFFPCLRYSRVNEKAW